MKQKKKHGERVFENEFLPDLAFLGNMNMSKYFKHKIAK